MEMAADPRLQPQDCNCLAVRQAARHVTQFYDQCLAPTGLRTTQFSILAKLRRLGPMTINTLAADLVMDRTTLGRNILPLERDGLVVVKPGAADRRLKELRLTEAGAESVRAGVKLWASAQARFETTFGPDRATELRHLLRNLVATDLAARPAAG
jgi:DNA-binding MarR family transcriptional regulator